ncbi:hypothetical protein DSO57_1032832 [Entomophthora muscae]|uniref:Uncharacterized protein n=2 Tax=Entomophthora muscae TaxID=34485 RepID=A0ACC2RUW7_9FUNG|nr:hypothetical protein DSO57_1020430 [Entomophthora muscae]KAJ9087493.1 hypothetical protein DSO57_1032832 [Entomophthora muscae]
MSPSYSTPSEEHLQQPSDSLDLKQAYLNGRNHPNPTMKTFEDLLSLFEAPPKETTSNVGYRLPR